MYAAIEDGKIIAIHDDYETILKFQRFEKRNIILKKLKKKKYESLKDDIDFNDLYLVRYGDRYIPFHLYDTLKHDTEEYLYDLNYAKDVLYRILEENEYSNKENKSISKAIMVLEDKISYHKNSIINGADLNTLYMTKLFNEEYKSYLK